jgi:hypothetical protein
VDEAVDLEAAVAKFTANKLSILPVIDPIYIFRVQRFCIYLGCPTWIRSVNPTMSITLVECRKRLQAPRGQKNAHGSICVSSAQSISHRRCRTCLSVQPSYLVGMEILCYRVVGRRAYRITDKSGKSYEISNARIRPKNGRDAPVGRRGKPAATSKGCRGATLCKFTTYSAGRYDGIPRTCSRLRGKAGESKRADRRRRRLCFYSSSTISRSVAHLETEETPLLLW